jgi:hypothetical protein
MVSVLAASVVNRGFEPRSGQTKNYKIGICCGEVTNTNVIVCLVLSNQGLNSRSTTLEASTLTITPPMMFSSKCKKEVDYDTILEKKLAWIRYLRFYYYVTDSDYSFGIFKLFL